MKYLCAIFGHRLALRLYVYQAALFMSIFAGSILIGRYVVQPGVRSERREEMLWLAQSLLVSARDPARAHEQIVNIAGRFGVSATMFGADGRVVEQHGTNQAAPLTTEALTRLLREGAVPASPESLAVADMQEGKLIGYVVIGMQRVTPWVNRASSLIAFFLIALAIGSVPLARTIARPLERLAKVTRDFGLGDLRVRAPVERRDEIGDLARTFNQMADRVEALRRTEKELLANVSHELRTPLARIRVVLELATEEDSAVGRRYFTEIAEDLGEIEVLLGDIITAAQLDLANERCANPYPPLRRLPVELRPLLIGLTQRFAEQHEGRIFECAIDDDAMISVDRVMFKHALLNLLDNAHKYSPIDRAIELRLSSDAKDNRVVIAVIDHGQGISPADLPHVFSPFFRADRSRARGTGGVGLGLTLARRIVEAHGGLIAINSRIGEGTKVTVSLPLDSPREARCFGALDGYQLS